MQTTLSTGNSKIQDFGQKIGGAKKDLAREYAEKIALVTNTMLVAQPFSKSFPKPDFVRMFKENLISEDVAIKLRYLYESIPAKPRTRGLQSWANKAMDRITLIKAGLDGNIGFLDNLHFQRHDYKCFEEIMKASGFPQEEFSSHPYRIIAPSLWEMTKQFRVAKSNMVKYRSNNAADCVNWIKENAGGKKAETKQQFEIRQYTVSKECFICPKGKPRIVVIKGLTLADAKDWLLNKHDQLVELYKQIRFVPNERNDWNRPRVGADYRSGQDISPATFNTAFPFRGVEFGNWVNQVERAGCLNEAYDALSELADLLAVDKQLISLNGTLAMAFGARGSGNAMAHYERDKCVINLTKTKGAGSLAHEWFHALDHYVSTCRNKSFSFATEEPYNLSNSELTSAISLLTTAIHRSPFKERSEEIDKVKTKKYWATMVEVSARAFEVYVVHKLALKGYHNDYLVNIKTIETYLAPEKYPYPTLDEIKELEPLFDKVFKLVFQTVLKQTA